MGELSFEDIFQDICKSLKEKSQVESLSKKFSLLKTDDQRYKFVEPFLRLYNFEINLQEYEKCDNYATKLREEGNKLFAKKKDTEALNLYTQSICYAPAKSKSLTLALANRSAVLKSLCHYEDCILDIDRALDQQYPESLAYKLLTRKAECYKCLGNIEKAVDNFLSAKKILQKAELSNEKLIELQKNLENQILLCGSCNDNAIAIDITSKFLPSPTYGENSEIICASDAVEIKFSDEMGRHVTATKDIKPGDVLIVEPSYASVLLPEFVHSYCSHCMKRCPALLPCTYCTLAMYCSKTCLESSWSSYHQIECSAMPTLLSLDMGKMSLLAARIVTKTGTENLSKFLQDPQNHNIETSRTLGFINGKYDSLEFSPIYNLITNTSTRTVPDLFKRSLMAASILNCLKLNSMPDSNLYGGLILKLLQSLPCNAHEVSELCKDTTDKVAHCVEIGAAAYATLSLLNHACDPNVVRHSHGTTAVLRAIRSIPAGTQILDNYGYHFAVHSKETRQTHLKNQYLFDCACEACVDSWPLHSNLPNKLLVESSIDLSFDILKNSFNDALDGKLSNEMLANFLNHISNLDAHNSRLCKEYNCCQEAIKQYFAKLGNYYAIAN